MTIWTRARLDELRHRAADLRAMHGEPDPFADPQLQAEAHRREAALLNQGEDTGYDPTHDPYRDPNRDPYTAPGVEV